MTFKPSDFHLSPLRRKVGSDPQCFRHRLPRYLHPSQHPCLLNKGWGKGGKGEMGRWEMGKRENKGVKVGRYSMDESDREYVG